MRCDGAVECDGGVLWGLSVLWSATVVCECDGGVLWRATVPSWCAFVQQSVADATVLWGTRCDVGRDSAIVLQQRQ